jgi:hypothetical protein
MPTICMPIDAHNTDHYMHTMLLDAYNLRLCIFFRVYGHCLTQPRKHQAVSVRTYKLYGQSYFRLSLYVYLTS